MNIDNFAQQLEVMYRRLDDLYKGASNSEKTLQLHLLPTAFKELGIVSEELQVAVDELQQQNEQLVDARTAIEVEHQRYKELFDFAPDSYLLTDHKGVIREANHAAAKLLNVSQRFLAGKPLIVFICEPEHQRFHPQLLNLLQNRQSQQEWLVKMCPRNGQPFDGALAVTGVSDWGGELAGVRIRIRQVSNNQGNLLSSKQVETSLKIDEHTTQDHLNHVYLKGEIINLKPQMLWQVLRGVVKLSTMNQKGEEVLVGFALPAMLFGSDLTSLQTYQAVALSDVHLKSFSVADILASQELSQVAFAQIGQRLKQTEALLAISGQRRVRDRFFELLQLLKQEIGQPVEHGTRLSVRFTHQEFADACSTTRVTITRLLGKLQQQGQIILDSNNHIVIREQQKPRLN